MKKFIALVLAVVFCTALSLSVLAEDNNADATVSDVSYDISSELSIDISSAISNVSSEISTDLSFDVSDVSSVSSEMSFETSSEVPLVSKNVALGKPYTTSELYVVDGKIAYPDENGKTLTDGKYPAEGKFSDPAFAGFNKNSEDVKVNGYSSVTVDLGETYNLDKLVVSSASKVLSNGISAPKGIEVYVSADNENWNKVGNASYIDSDADAYVDATVELEEAVDARYVQYRVLPHTEAGTAAWMFVCEVQAFANVEGDANDVSNTTSTPVKPGDASNVVVFAIIALVAMAGSAVVIKNRK
ncbi:MAG: discoidin domain-containing protein [Clostridia bacterium]|nr:discoidin domain-containing protein [Clostridia bacterium]